MLDNYNVHYCEFAKKIAINVLIDFNNRVYLLAETANYFMKLLRLFFAGCFQCFLRSIKLRTTLRI